MLLKTTYLALILFAVAATLVAQNSPGMTKDETAVRQIVKQIEKEKK